MGGFLARGIVPAVLVILAAIGGAMPARATPYDTLASIAGAYNLFTLGNLGTTASPYASSIQGSVAVAGNAYLSNAVIDSSFSGSAAAVVGGNLSQSGGVADGNVFVGGASANFSGGATVLGSVNMTASASALTYGASLSPTGMYVTPTTTVNVPFYMSGLVHTSGGAATPLDVFGSAADVTNASTALGALAATSVVSSGGVLTINLNSSGLDVVDVTVPNGTTITGVNVVTANGVTPTGLVLNITGDNLKFNGGAYTTGGLANSAVLYNFTNATNLSFNALAFQGDLLAPLATVSFANGQVNGSVIANNFIGNVPLYMAGFTDPLPAYSTGATTATGGGTSVPEPASLPLFAGALAVLMLIWRRYCPRE